MAGMSDYLEGQIRGHIFRSATFVKPTVLAISLHTADPTDVTATAASTEVANSGGYARVACNPLDANWSIDSAIGGTALNTNPITFPAPTGLWGVVTHIGIWSSAAYGGGNLLFKGPLLGNVSKTINNGDAAPSFAALTLTVTLA